MSSEVTARPAIVVDETYIYNIDVAEQTNMSCEHSHGMIKISVPYDGLHLKDIPNQPGGLHLGSFTMGHPADPANQQLIDITLPVDTVSSQIKHDVQYAWQARYDIAPPHNTLIAMDGEVFDGAAIDPNKDGSDLYHMLFGQTDVFMNDLRLQLSLWVPNLFAQTPLGSPVTELRAMLVEQQSQLQVLVPDPTQHRELARHMVALANGAGGRLLLGVKTTGEPTGLNTQVHEQLELHLLKALLLCTPSIPIFAPEYYTTDDAKVVARVVVGPNTGTTYAVERDVYRRHGGETVLDRSAQLPAAVTAESPLGNVSDLLAAGNTQDLVQIDAKGLPIDQIELGPYICGLLNADIRSGILLIRNVSPGEQPMIPLPWRSGRNIVQRMRARLQEEQRRLTPLSGELRPEFTTIGEERIVVLRVIRSLAPAALCEQKGYVWANGLLREVSVQDVFERYLRRVGTHDLRRPSSATVTMDYGQLDWPVQPPRQLKAVTSANAAELSQGVYDVQRQAIVWSAQPFEQQEGTNGFNCRLSTRLRQRFRPNGSQLNEVDTLSGTFRIRFDHVLASGMEFARATQHPTTGEPIAAHPLLMHAPIVKRTFLVLHVQVRTYELFQRRKHMSILHFRMPDVALGQERRERVADLRQACADLGFWVYDVYPAESDDSSSPYVLMRGIRSTGYQDIHMLAGVRYESTQIQRQLQFDKRIDSKEVQAGQLDARLVMWGNLDPTPPDDLPMSMAELQLELRQIIQQRLQYLRAE